MKQDIVGVRTAQDLEKKYNFSSMKRAIELQEKGLTKTNTELDKFVNATTSSIGNLQEQIDGNITTYYYSGIPTLNSLPVSEWELTDYNKHLGDLYYDKDTGYAYRFYLDSNTGVYGWTDIKDNDVKEALALANAAKDTADSKRRVFTTQPIPPYDNGDMWINNQEIYICQISKPEGQTFNVNDFIIATKYTDDTKANQVDGKLTVLGGTVTEVVENVNNLTTTMTNTQTIVNEHGEEIGTLKTQQSEVEQTIESITATIESNYYDKTTTEQMLIDLENGITNTFSQSGGNNIFYNSIGNDGSNYWENPHEVYTDTEIQQQSGQKTGWLLNNTTATQTLTLKNGTYYVSFIYKKLLNLANVTVKLNNTLYTLTETDFTEFGAVVNVTDNTLTIEISSDTDASAYLLNLMGNLGTTPSPFTLNANETSTDTVTIGKGISIVATGINTKFKADADGIRIIDTTNESNSTEFTDKGTKTRRIEADSGNIARLLFKDTGEQTFISRV